MLQNHEHRCSIVGRGAIQRNCGGGCTVVQGVNDKIAYSGLAAPNETGVRYALPYRGIANGVAAGQWDFVIEADRDGKRLFLSRNRVVLN